MSQEKFHELNLRKTSFLKKRNKERQKTMHTLLQQLNKRSEVVQQPNISHQLDSSQIEVDNKEEYAITRETEQSQYQEMPQPSEQIQQRNQRMSQQEYSSQYSSMNRQIDQQTQIWEKRSSSLLKQNELKAQRIQSQTSLNGKLFITSAQTNHRKMSSSRLQEKQPQKYKIAKFEDYEIKACSSVIDQEKQDWNSICELKKQAGENFNPYVEQVYQFDLKFKRKETLQSRKQQRKALSQSLQIFQEQNNSNRCQSAINKPVQKSEIQIGAQAKIKDFNKMNIMELKQHEIGILNLYEQNLLKRQTHNRSDRGQSVFDIKLTPFEYESIFDNPPSFPEKKAFVDVFRKKWKEDKGYCSVFDKRQIYKTAKQEKNITVERRSQLERPKTTMSFPKRSKSRIMSQSYVRNFTQSKTPDLLINGCQAKFNNPIQNSDPNNLNDFITQLYDGPFSHKVSPSKASIKILSERETGINEDIINNIKNLEEKQQQITHIKQVINMPNQQFSPYSHNNQSQVFEFKDSERDQIIGSNTSMSNILAAVKLVSQEQRNSTIDSKTSQKDQLKEIPQIGHVQKIEKQAAIFTLPQNPINLCNFKYNFLKNKLENNRLDNIQLSSGLSYKLDQEKIKNKYEMLQNQLADQILPHSLDKDEVQIDKLNCNKLKNAFVRNYKLIKQRNEESIEEYANRSQSHTQSKRKIRPVTAKINNKKVNRPSTSNLSIAFKHIENSIVGSQSQKPKQIKTHQQKSSIEIGTANQSQNQSTLTQINLMANDLIKNDEAISQKNYDNKDETLDAINSKVASYRLIDNKF